MKTDLRLSLRALRAFVATVDHGSITGAAQALNVAASAVAAAIDQVEAEFGANLLVRSRARGIATTAEGREIADRFRALLEDYSDLMEHGHNLAQSLSGVLRIGYYAPVAPAFLPGILRPMLLANPALRIVMQAHDNDSAQEALLNGQLDVILFAGQDVRSGIETRVLLDLPPYVLVPAGHPLAKYDVPLTLDQVAAQPIVQLDRPLARPYQEQLFRAHGLTPSVVARVDSTEMVRSLVGAGIGVAVLSMRPLTDTSYAGQALCALPLDPELPRLQLFEGHIKGRPRRLVAAFVNALETFMSTQDAQALICD